MTRPRDPARPRTTFPLRARLRSALDGGASYAEAATQLGLPAGLAYQVATGQAADGSHGDNTEPTQQLVNPHAVNPTAREAVHDWIRRRVGADQQMQAAKGNS